MHLALQLLLVLAQAPAPALPPAPATPPVLARPAVIGASVSAGFGLQREAGRSLDFSDVLAALLAVETEKPLDEASQWFFVDPGSRAEEQVEGVLAEEPSVLFGVDFLFWFAYGERTTAERHLVRFEQGLALLDRFDCPIVVGDLPDMSLAVDAPVKMLSEHQVPEPEVLERLNARLRSWAAERPRVCIVPLSDFVRRLIKGDRLEVHGNTWEEASSRVLQADRLHPSLEGTVALALLALDTLDRAREDVKPEMVRWSAAEALKALRPPASKPSSAPAAAPAGGR